MSDDKHQDVEEHSIAPPVEVEFFEPHIHAKTYLVIFVSRVLLWPGMICRSLVTDISKAMFMINFTSVICLVTAGAVSLELYSALSEDTSSGIFANLSPSLVQCSQLLWEVPTRETGSLVPWLYQWLSSVLRLLKLLTTGEDVGCLSA